MGSQQIQNMVVIKNVERAEGMDIQAERAIGDGQTA